MVKRHFSFTELLVVCLCVLLVGAMLVPVYGNATRQAKQYNCTDNLKGIGIMLAIYADDHDDVLLPAFRIYPGDHIQNWMYYLWQTYKLDPKSMLCPEADDAFAIGSCPANANYHRAQSYGMHYESVLDNYQNLHPSFTRALLQEQGQNPAAHILVADSVANATGTKSNVPGDISAFISAHGGYYQNGELKSGGGWYPVHIRHNNKANLLMHDGHVEARSGEEIFANDKALWKPMFYDWKWQK